MSDAALSETAVSGSENEKFIIFTLGDEKFATPLLSVKEVIEPQKITEIPNTTDFFLGMINLRGEIIGVVDLRVRFKKEVNSGANNSLLIFDTSVGSIAAYVDKTDSVREIEENKIERNPNVSSVVPLEYLLGMASIDEDLITILDLSKVLEKDELNKISNVRN